MKIILLFRRRRAAQPCKTAIGGVSVSFFMRLVFRQVFVSRSAVTFLASEVCRGMRANWMLDRSLNRRLFFTATQNGFCLSDNPHFPLILESRGSASSSCGFLPGFRWFQFGLGVLMRIRKDSSDLCAPPGRCG